MHKLKILSLGLVLLSQSALGAAPRGGAELLNPSAYSLNFNTSMFSSTGYYDLEGTEQTLPDGYEYKLIDVDFGLSYGVGKNFEVGTFGRFRSVTSTANDVTTDASGLESLGIEAKYAFPAVGNIRYAVGGHFRKTLYSASTGLSEELALGDAGSEYGVDLLMTYNGPVKLDGRIGYNSPGNNLSGEIPYMIQGMYRFSQLGVFGGVEGIFSMNNDEYTETPTQKPSQNTGVTALFNSINREKIAPFLGVNYAFSKAVIALKGQTVVSGASTDKGNTISLNFTWGSEGVTSESVKIDSFKEYHIEGSVLKVSARGNFLRIDQGLSTDVEKGMKFDIYQTDYFGGNVLVASGVVYEVGTDWSVIKLLKKYKEIVILPGFAARGY